MSYSAQSHQRSPKRNAWPSRAREADRETKRVKLLTELTRQRALLMESTHLSRLAEQEPEVCPDPIDHASTEFEQEFALQVRLRTFDKLRRVEQALQLMRTSGYGWAVRRDRTRGNCA